MYAQPPPLCAYRFLAYFNNLRRNYICGSRFLLVCFSKELTEIKIRSDIALHELKTTMGKMRTADLQIIRWVKMQILMPSKS